MSNVVNEITITYAKVKEDTLDLEWILNGGDMPFYSGEYTIHITEDGGDFANQTFTTEDGSTNYTIQFSQYKREKIYKVELSAGVISDYCTLIVDTFTQLEGTYDASTFVFQWQIKSDGFLPDGFCHMEEKIKPDSDKNTEGTESTESIESTVGKNAVNFTVNPSYGLWDTNKIHYSGEYPVCVTFAGNDGQVCDGPDSEELYFYPKGVKLLTADFTSGADAETLTLTFCQVYEDVPELCLHFKKANHLLFQTEAEIKFNKKENVCTAEVALPHNKVMPQVLRECVVHCYYKNGQALSKVDTALSSMSLAIPKVKPLELGKQCQGNITIDGERIPTGYEFTDNSIIYSSTGKCPGDFKARACYDVDGVLRRGPWSVNGFEPCYYAGNQVVTYKQRSLEPEEQKCTFPIEWFVNSGTQPISSGGITLTFGEKECELKIQTNQAITVEAYDTFLSQIKDIAVPKAFYKISEAILRMGAFAFSHAAHFLCGYTPEDKIADLRPGLFMKTETSLYLPPYNTKIKNVDGFVWANSAECEISFSEQTGFLEFNSFAAEMLKSAGSSVQADNTKVIYAAGIEDLLRPALRQPYIRILYPSDIPQQDTSLPYPSENVILMAADRYGKILEACANIKNNPSSINNLSIPVVVFRGRGMLTLMMEIYINERKIHVPVGSNIEQVLSRCGISSLQKVHLYRRSYDGDALRVFGEIDGIGLISGDMIEL